MEDVVDCGEFVVERGSLVCWEVKSVGISVELTEAENIVDGTKVGSVETVVSISKVDDSVVDVVEGWPEVFDPSVAGITEDVAEDGGCVPAVSSAEVVKVTGVPVVEDITEFVVGNIDDDVVASKVEELLVVSTIETLSGVVGSIEVDSTTVEDAVDCGNVIEDTEPLVTVCCATVGIPAEVVEEAKTIVDGTAVSITKVTDSVVDVVGSSVVSLALTVVDGSVIAPIATIEELDSVIGGTNVVVVGPAGIVWTELPD